MSYRGIFLDKIHPNVRAKLDKLHRDAGAIRRENHQITQRTPWIRLTSNAKSSEPKFPKAEHYVLYPSTIDTTKPAPSH